MQIFSINRQLYSSSKDQLTGMNVAIKKIMKPFSAPVLAKRTYRELKLLKALMHENVSIIFIINKREGFRTNSLIYRIDYQFERHFHFSIGRHVSFLLLLLLFWHFLLRKLFILIYTWFRYFVTELLGTDLHRLLQSRPLEKQFIQYFLYQILVTRK